MALRQRHHEDALRSHIEELADRGWTFIPWASLYRWYDADKITKRVYRDLRERFLMEIEEEFEKWSPGDKRLEKDLWVYSAPEGAVLLHFDELRSVTKLTGEPAIMPELSSKGDEEEDEIGIPRRAAGN